MSPIAAGIKEACMWIRCVRNILLAHERWSGEGKVAKEDLSKGDEYADNVIMLEGRFRKSVAIKFALPSEITGAGNDIENGSSK